MDKTATARIIPRCRYHKETSNDDAILWQSGKRHKWDSRSIQETERVTGSTVTLILDTAEKLAETTENAVSLKNDAQGCPYRVSIVDRDAMYPLILEK